MPYQTLPQFNQRYALVRFNKSGEEEPEIIEGSKHQFSEQVLTDLATQPVTDIFCFSHGWQSDVPGAIQQYDRWIGTVLNVDSDRQRMVQVNPKFHPFHIGLHWPSQPWGDESLPGDHFSAIGVPPLEQWLKDEVQRLGDTPEIRRCIQTLFEEARQNAGADQLTDVARRAYLDLNAALDLGDVGLGGPPGDDREPFDPDQAFANSQAEGTSFGDLNFSGLLAPLRQLSFWTMKKRARRVGETGLHELLKQVQQAAPSARIHLMGHSFGCIVVSAIALGSETSAPLLRSIDSMVLVQGALSLWSYCSDIPHLSGKAGYFHRLIRDRSVTGPIVTTFSRFDTANRCFYPWGAGVTRQIDFAPLPKYGALGIYGIQGLLEYVHDETMLPVEQDYSFQPGNVYNLNSSHYIKHGGGLAGAHNDIDNEGVAHAIWQAAMP